MAGVSGSGSRPTSSGFQQRVNHERVTGQPGNGAKQPVAFFTPNKKLKLLKDIFEFVNKILVRFFFPFGIAVCCFLEREGAPSLTYRCSGDKRVDSSGPATPAQTFTSSSRNARSSSSRCFPECCGRIFPSEARKHTQATADLLQPGFWPLSTKKRFPPLVLHFQQADKWPVWPFQAHIVSLLLTSPAFRHTCKSPELFMLCGVFNTPSCKSEAARHEAVRTPL